MVETVFCRPGGKYGEPISEEAAEARKAVVNEHDSHLAQASSVLSSVVAEVCLVIMVHRFLCILEQTLVIMFFQVSLDDTSNSKSAAVSTADAPEPSLAGLSSKMWSELL